MYTAKERETLVIETAHSLSLGLFRCPRTFEKSASGHRLQEEVDTEQLHADGLTMGKGADIFALISRGHRGDRIPPRESLLWSSVTKTLDHNNHNNHNNPKKGAQVIRKNEKITALYERLNRDDFGKDDEQQREERKDRLHQNYLKWKASGAQKRYEDKIKERKKAKIEAKKAAIRAEDIAKGVFVPVSSLPQREPMKGVQTA